MVQMTIVDVVRLTYPGEIEKGNVAFGQDRDNPIFITSWTVPDVQKPSREELENLIPSLQPTFDIFYFLTVGKPQLANYIDSVAQERDYDNAVACASYANSTVAAWKTEADVFISWRDFVYAYTINQVELMQQRARTVPTFEQFSDELPLIKWP